MSFWDTIKGLTHDAAAHNLYARLPKEQTDVASDDRLLLPEKGYFRVWVKEIFLASSREWFKTWYPAMTCSVRVPQTGGLTPTFTRVTGTDAQNLGPAVLKGYARRGAGDARARSAPERGEDASSVRAGDQRDVRGDGAALRDGGGAGATT